MSGRSGVGTQVCLTSELTFSPFKPSWNKTNISWALWQGPLVSTQCPFYLRILSTSSLPDTQIRESFYWMADCRVHKSRPSSWMVPSSELQGLMSHKEAYLLLCLLSHQEAYDSMSLGASLDRNPWALMSPWRPFNSLFTLIPPWPLPLRRTVAYFQFKLWFC